MFGGAKVQKFLQTQIPDDSPLESTLINKSLDSAQQRVEERAYEQRKQLIDYDEILNIQRNIVYFERQLMLESDLARKNNFGFAEQIICDYLTQISSKKIDSNELFKTVINIFGQNLEIFDMTNFTSTFSLVERKKYFYQEFWLNYELKLSEYCVTGSIKAFRDNEQRIGIGLIDQIWQEHLEKLTLLREAVAWRGYGQKNPLTEYKREAYNLFSQRKEILVYSIIYDIFRLVSI